MEKNPYAMITKGDSKPKKEIEEIRSKRSHDGKVIHTHIHHHPEHHPNEHHVSANMAEHHDHIERHFGMPNDGESPSMAPDAAPVTASPSPMAPPAEAAPAPAAE